MKRLIIDGNLDLSNTPISILPNNMTVEGDLDLDDCTSLKSLPSGLVVKGWLSLVGCRSITSLPKDLVVHIFLFLDHSGIQNKYNLFSGSHFIEKLREKSPEVFK